MGYRIIWIVLLVSLYFFVDSSISETIKSNDSTYTHLNHRYRAIWHERNANFSSSGIQFAAQEYNVAHRIGYKINGFFMLYNHTWYIQGDATRYSFREVVNSFLILFADAVGENTGGQYPKFYPRTALTYILFLPNSEIRYHLKKSIYISFGTETNYFFFRSKDLDRGMITSLKLELPIEVGEATKHDRFLIAPFIKTNTFISFEGDNKWYGWSIGLRLISSTDAWFD